MTGWVIPYLSGTCDESFDDEHLPLDTWNKINAFLMRSSWKNVYACYQWAARQSCIGPLFTRFLSMEYAAGYEMAVCFIEAHEEASKMMKSTIDNKDLCDIILKEA